MIPYIVAAASMVHRLRRVCPRCHREQVVPMSLCAQTVACRWCRAPMQPRSPQARR